YIGDSVTTNAMMIIGRVATNIISIFYAGTSATVAYDGTAWMHVKLTFDTGTDTFSGSVNGVEIVTDEAFVGSVNSVGLTLIQATLETGNQEGFYDAIGYSWDSDYNVGDNQYAEEGEANKVVFEGIAVKPTKGRFQFVLVENQGSEMEYISPRGNKSGRSDEIIVDINNDGAPDGPTYITDGTLANGGAMGTLDLSGAKLLRTVYNDLAEHDAFLWNLRPQGALDYNAGSVDSKAVIRNDVSTYTDTILQVQAWTVAKLNQIIVNGAINPITGSPYTGIWNDEADQQANGINGDTVEDAQLNTNTLCQAKADTMGGNETVRIRVRFKFRKTGYGLIQVGQIIIFLYDITNYITISSAQYILDKIIMNIKTEIGYAEISSGL
ncbi:hypothetical protein LCGC14_1634520, partial [marine sediment metagenome]